MVKHFENKADIQEQVDQAAQEIDLFCDEIQADDLARYPNFAEKLQHFLRVINQTEKALLSIEELDLSVDDVDLDDLKKVTEVTISEIAGKLKTNNLNLLLETQNALLNLQNMLQESTLGGEA